MTTKFIIKENHNGKDVYLNHWIDMSFIGGRSAAMTSKKEEAKTYTNKAEAEQDAKEVGKTATVETIE